MNVLRFAFRTLAKTPFLTGLAVLSLGLGIGANGAIFSLFDQILLRPLPVTEPQQLVNLSAPGPKSGSTSCTSEGSCEDICSYAMFKDLQGAETGLSGIALHRTFGANLATTESTTSGAGLLVSGNYFSLLGVQPELGRLLGPTDDEQFGGHPVAVLSYRYWERQLGQDPSVLNSTIVVNGQPLTVIGVATSDFDGTTLGFRPDVFVPVTMRAALTPGWDDFDNRRNYRFYLMGRLPDGVSIEQAGLAINLVYSSILNEVEAPLQEGMSDNGLERFKARQIVLEDGFRGQSSIQSSAGAPLSFLLGVTGLVLVIACANIANLLLARGAGRAREMAIRGSMGASSSPERVALLMIQPSPRLGARPPECTGGLPLYPELSCAPVSLFSFYSASPWPPPRLPRIATTSIRRRLQMRPFCRSVVPLGLAKPSTCRARSASRQIKGFRSPQRKRPEMSSIT
jgi:hypothetical protein